MKINYSFSFTAPTPVPTKVPDELVEYSYNEFGIDLPLFWRQIPNSGDNTIKFVSDQDNTSIIVAADFYDISEDKALGVAQKSIESRLEAHEQQFPGQVELLARSIRTALRRFRSRVVVRCRSGTPAYCDVPWICDFPEDFEFHDGLRS